MFDKQRFALSAFFNVNLMLTRYSTKLILNLSNNKAKQ